MAYLFVHFREKTTPDGEQVYFGLSRDGFCWEEVNGGSPVLWAYYGDKGVRDHTIVRNQADGKYHIFATDLSLAYGMRGKYENSWENVSRNGSKCLAHWESEDLVHWTEQELVKLGDEGFGCLWAPDVVYDRKQGDYVLHWSSSHADNGYGPKGIFYSRTRDFRQFTKPALLYREESIGVIDSAIYEEAGMYYMFLKHEHNPARIIELCALRMADGVFSWITMGYLEPDRAMCPLWRRIWPEENLSVRTGCSLFHMGSSMGPFWRLARRNTVESWSLGGRRIRVAIRRGI